MCPGEAQFEVAVLTLLKSKQTQCGACNTSIWYGYRASNRSAKTAKTTCTVQAESRGGVYECFVMLKALWLRGVSCCRPSCGPRGGPRAHVAMPAPVSIDGVGADARRARVDRPTGPCGGESGEGAVFTIRASGEGADGVRGHRWWERGPLSWLRRRNKCACGKRCNCAQVF